MPGLVPVVREWTSRDPTFGLSLFTPVYYHHIAVSLDHAGSDVWGDIAGVTLATADSQAEHSWKTVSEWRTAAVIASTTFSLTGCAPGKATF